jgi:hypothetical protein
LESDGLSPLGALSQSILERLPWGYARSPGDAPTPTPLAKAPLAIDAHLHRRTALLLVDLVAAAHDELVRLGTAACVRGGSAAAVGPDRLSAAAPRGERPRWTSSAVACW